MSSLLRTSRLIDLCTPSISYDRQVQSGSIALDNQMYPIIDDTGQVVMISTILDLTNSTLVDILAWQFHVDFYDTSKDLDFRKQLVHDSIQWHMTKGTLALVQHVLDVYFPGGATIQEWFQYKDPFPPNYPIVDPDAFVRTFATSDVNPSTDKFTLNGHGLVNNQQIRFLPGSGGTLPTPLLPDVWYYVINSTTNSFQVASGEGAAAINLSNSGVGSANEIWKRGLGSWHDRYRFRVLIDEHQIDPATEAIVIELIERYKPISRWLEGFVASRVSECDICWVGMLLRFIYRTSEAPDYP